jgi:hypothetical protein
MKQKKREKQIERLVNKPKKKQQQKQKYLPVEKKYQYSRMYHLYHRAFLDLLY